MSLRKNSTGRRALLAGCLASCVFVAQAVGVELKPSTVLAFDAYIRSAEAQMDADVKVGRFLAVDRLPEPRRRQAYDALRHGGIYVESLQAHENGRPLHVSGGLIHDWVGVIFMPGATLSKADGVLHDYANQEKIYRPEIQKSKLLERNGDSSKVLLRFYYKSIATAVVDASFDMRSSRPADDRVMIKARSTRIVEIKNASRQDERQLPEGKDSGYLWRLNTYWRLQAKDGGVYLQIQTIGLTRSIPAVLAPVVGPLTRTIPRKVLTDLLNDTRIAVIPSTYAKKARS